MSWCAERGLLGFTGGGIYLRKKSPGAVVGGADKVAADCSRLLWAPLLHPEWMAWVEYGSDQAGPSAGSGQSHVCAARKIDAEITLPAGLRIRGPEIARLSCERLRWLDVGRSGRNVKVK